jgi:hypothetical protein
MLVVQVVRAYPYPFGDTICTLIPHTYSARIRNAGGLRTGAGGVWNTHLWFGIATTASSSHPAVSNVFSFVLYLLSLSLTGGT